MNQLGTMGLQVPFILPMDAVKVTSDVLGDEE